MLIRLVAGGVIGAWLAAGAGVSRSQRAPELTFVPVAGNWQTSVEAGQKVLTANGTATPLTPDASLGNLRELFGPRAEVFAKNAAGPGAFPLAIVRETPDFRGGRIRAEFKLISGASDQTAGVVFNVRDDGTYHFGRFNTKDGNVALWSFENGKRTVISHGEAHRQLALDQWHDIALTVRGRTVTISAAKDTLRATHTLPSPIQGRIGFWTKADSVTAFRGLTVRPE